MQQMEAVSGLQLPRRAPLTPPPSADFVMMEQLKDKFLNVSPAEQVTIMTAAPASMSARKLAGEFGTTRYKASMAARLAKQGGAFTPPPPLKGKELSQEVIDAVQVFYRSDELTRQMPGGSDCKSRLCV